MTPERWKQVERLYLDSIDLEPDERPRFLASAGVDEDVRGEVESLLAHRGPGLTFIERRGIDVAAEIVTRRPAEPLVGKTVGRYHVTSLVGAGGMGVVYRARDTRLGRDVALKVFPEDFSDDPDRLLRSEREARLLAALNHPNIAGIYDLAESGSIQCLVLEFVEGETLAARLKRGRISLAEALSILRQIAEALEAAHEQGVVHQDLKPANVMISPNGTVKVLDFGIAKLLAPEGSRLSEGTVDTCGAVAAVGTPSYMSPEQACGKPADKRTDIWAFGCVLYEVLTGRRAFEEETISRTLAAIIEGEPDCKVLPTSTPVRLENLLRRCLHKDPRWRLRDIGDARIELADDQNQTQQRDTVAEAAAGTRLFWTMGALVLVLIAALAVWQMRPATAFPEMHVEVTTPPSADPVSLAISPDGRTIALVATYEGRSRLWLRSLNSTSSRWLDGTDGASCPFWSPTNTSIGFFADAKLKRIDIDTGSVRTLTNALSCGGTWNRDGTMLFSGALFGPISRIPETGGGPAAEKAITLTERPVRQVTVFLNSFPMAATSSTT